jgi:hypothetical protein
VFCFSDEDTMAFVIRALNEDGEPVENVPLVLMFNGLDRREASTNGQGEVRFDHCPGVNVQVTADGIAQGVYPCYDGQEITIEV